MIPVLPNVIKDFVEVPLPFLIGVNASPEELKQYPENEGFPVIVMLDKGEIIQAKEMRTPDLNELKRKLKNCYGKECMRKHESRVGDYFSTESQAGEVCSEIESVLKKLVINRMPSFCDIVNGEFDLEKIKREVKAKTCKADLEFIDKFLETQLFVNYVEHHSNP